MNTAIHHQRRIAFAQKMLLRRIRQELRHRIKDVVVGYQGGNDKLTVFANNRIWFAHQPLENAPIPRYGNAFGIGPPELQRSNAITVEINPAIRRVDRRVAGLFAIDDEIRHTVLLHRGSIGGGKQGIGKASFMPRFKERYPERLVEFIDPSREDASDEQAILVADVESDEFLIQLESFVDAVHKFKDSHEADNPTSMSNTELSRLTATDPKITKVYTASVAVFSRDRCVAEYAKRRADGKCELCGKPAPFKNASNETYLESHHIVWLAREGLDSIENTVALCPNCHRKMHVVNDAQDIEKLNRRAGRVLGG